MTMRESGSMWAATGIAITSFSGWRRAILHTRVESRRRVPLQNPEPGHFSQVFLPARHQRILAGAGEEEPEEDGAQLERVRCGRPSCAGGVGRPAQMGHHGDEHREREKKRRGPEEHADDHEQRADGFRERGHESPENRDPRNTKIAHAAADALPALHAARELSPAMKRHYAQRDDDAQHQQTKVAVDVIAGEKPFQHVTLLMKKPWRRRTLV